MRVLLLSAYDADSHGAWRNAVTQGLNDWEWTQLTLPPRHFSWRVRGNPLYWSVADREQLERPYDCVLATSMVDLATLRGLVPGLSAHRTLLYFHENQFAYPPGRSRHSPVEVQMVSLYSAMAADVLLFNSDFNRRTFLAGSEALLQGMPDYVPPGLIEELARKSSVLPVPIVRLPESDSRRHDGPMEILWNHRWEYDKGPELLLAIARRLLQRSQRFVFNVVGQQFRQCPREFEALKMQLEHAGVLGEWGYIESRRDYQALLLRSHVVLSTAAHDFQGLAMLEACAAGASPIAPADLAYPEWIPGECLYSGGTEADRAEQAVALIEQRLESYEQGRPLLRPGVERFYPDRLLPEYRAVLIGQRSGKALS